MKEIVIDAKVENLPQVLEFIDSELVVAECKMKDQMKIDMAVEELYVNIAHYAYRDKVGKAEITFDVDDKNRAVITLIDSGIHYDPLAKEDPDVTLSAEERKIGGLGIYMVKNSMDDVLYEYVDGKNKTTIIKNL
ncbi:ATP-binding protein [Butyrivibrio sp. WCE2006]|uniref:ATP-binding protein n=1 Tax=Butyrivibrio sp. WCE2006 TaxID=1410611 RepID=UPI0005D1AD7E|nr:ATP-binding protein [Butyrivibrio sp. WCE2006]